MADDVIIMPNGLPAVDDGTGELRVLARLEPYARQPFAMADERLSLQPMSAWQEVFLDAVCNLQITNQGQSSSCVGHGTGTCFDVAWQVAGQPLPPNPFSRNYLYTWINGGRDAGAVISDAATALKIHGNCTVREAPEGTLFRQQLPPDADQVAALYKPLLILKCHTFDDICASISAGFPVVVGIVVGQNFARLEDDGVCPLANVPLGGHCLAALRLKRHPKYQWVVGVQNSWGVGFGEKGYAYLRREHFDTPTDAFAIGAVLSPQGPVLPVAA